MECLTPQQNFELACEQYEMAMGIIRELSKYAITNDSDMSFKTAMRQYDWILQCILLSASVGDDYYLSVENKFIEDIARYGNVLDLINSESRLLLNKITSFNWDTLTSHISSMDKGEKIKFTATFGAFVSSHTDDFIRCFARFDADSNENYIEKLDRITGLIMLSLATADGDDYRDIADNLTDIGKEMQLGLQVKNIMLTNRINEEKGKLFTSCDVETSIISDVETVSLKRIIAFPEKYVGMELTIDESLVIKNNDVSNKYFRTSPQTGYARHEYNTDINIDIYYDETADIEDCIMLDADCQRIKVTGKVKIYDNSGKPYINATNIEF